MTAANSMLISSGLHREKTLELLVEDHRRELSLPR
jgi:hypothetical protein